MRAGGVKGGATGHGDEAPRGEEEDGERGDCCNLGTVSLRTSH